jgi:hypothetical protein
VIVDPAGGIQSPRRVIADADAVTMVRRAIVKPG